MKIEVIEKPAKPVEETLVVGGVYLNDNGVIHILTKDASPVDHDRPYRFIHVGTTYTQPWLVCYAMNEKQTRHHLDVFEYVPNARLVIER